jgi:auxin efflux carrier family protein
MVWSTIYNVLSLALGATAAQVFELPSWVTPAIAFNNTTSLPLLLIQSLDATRILSRILMGSNDSTSDAVNHAKSYFPANAIVGNSLTGPSC